MGALHDVSFDDGSDGSYFAYDGNAGSGYECPQYIKYAFVPGNVESGPGHNVTVGDLLHPLHFLEGLGVSGGGIPFGTYQTATGGPWVSDDGKVKVISGTMDGYCRMTRFFSAGPVFTSYTGAFQVYAVDLDWYYVSDDDQTCDASYEEDLEDETEGTGCEGFSTGSNGGDSGSTVGDGTDCTDEWVEIDISFDGGETWTDWWDGYATVCTGYAE